MQRVLPIKAIDEAFIAHMGRLFERFTTDIRGESHDRERNPEKSTALAAFKKEYEYACTAHNEAVKLLDSMTYD